MPSLFDNPSTGRLFLPDGRGGSSHADKLSLYFLSFALPLPSLDEIVFDKSAHALVGRGLLSPPSLSSRSLTRGLLLDGALDLLADKGWSHEANEVSPSDGLVESIKSI